MSGPVVVVTGANRGIGREIARQLVARGARVVVTARDAAKAGHAASELGAAAGIALDVASEQSALAAAEAVRERFGRLDALVNNAGVMIDVSDSPLDTDEAVIRETFETNTLGPWRVTKAFWGLMGEGGRVVNMSSGGGQLSEPAGWAPAYCVSKTALNAVTVQFALAGQPAGIAVNAMCPGWVKTDMGGPGAPRSLAQGADTAVWLALDAPSSLTGAFLRDRQPIPW